MAETLIVTENGSKKQIYEELVPQIRALTQGENDLVANLANITAAIKQTLGFFWVGFYLVKGEELVLGPFQGPIACTRIAYGRGVCGVAWRDAVTVIVPNVEEFPGHIACSSASKSEIVVPITRAGSVVGVLDVDADVLNEFSETDKEFLEEICNEIPW